MERSALKAGLFLTAASLLGCAAVGAAVYAGCAGRRTGAASADGASTSGESREQDGDGRGAARGGGRGELALRADGKGLLTDEEQVVPLAPARVQAALGGFSTGDGPLDELWARATLASLDEDEAALRLAIREGAAGLLEGAAKGAPRVAVARALGFAPGFEGLPWLAELLESGSDAEALVVRDALASIGARVRTAEDNEDLEEMLEGCSLLRRLATSRAPKPRRAAAISLVRALSDRGCGGTGPLPTDLDGKG